MLKDLFSNIGNLDRYIKERARKFNKLTLLVYLSETQKELMRQLLENPDLVPPEQREKLLKDLLTNIGSLGR